MLSLCIPIKKKLLRDCGYLRTNCAIWLHFVLFILVSAYIGVYMDGAEHKGQVCALTTSDQVGTVALWKRMHN